MSFLEGLNLSGGFVPAATPEDRAEITARQKLHKQKPDTFELRGDDFDDIVVPKRKMTPERQAWLERARQNAEDDAKAAIPYWVIRTFSDEDEAIMSQMTDEDERDKYLEKLKAEGKFEVEILYGDRTPAKIQFFPEHEEEMKNMTPEKRAEREEELKKALKFWILPPPKKVD
jgi:hypothetical protein